MEKYVNITIKTGRMKYLLLLLPHNMCPVKKFVSNY